MTTQINLRIEETILKEIDRATKKELFIKNRTEYIKRAIEEKLTRDKKE